MGKKEMGREGGELRRIREGTLIKEVPPLTNNISSSRSTGTGTGPGGGGGTGDTGDGRGEGVAVADGAIDLEAVSTMEASAKAHAKVTRAAMCVVRERVENA